MPSYLEHGDGAPVVIVHASSTDQRIWAPHAVTIGEHFHVIAPTQRYFGTSPWPGDGERFSVATHAADLAEFIRALRLDPVSIVGWSYGAAVCLMMAAQRPELVQQLVLYEPAIASFVDAPLDAQAAAADRHEMTAQARAHIATGDARAAVRAFMDGVNDQDGAFENLAPRVQQIMLENSRTLALLFAAPAPKLNCDDLRRLEGTRVVVARGDATRAFYRIAAEWTIACVPASTLEVVPNARHLLPVQDRERFATLVLDLLMSSPR
jgi:pimeloyl-ACP methyl ester carboxylesterase